MLLGTWVIWGLGGPGVLRVRVLLLLRRWIVMMLLGLVEAVIREHLRSIMRLKLVILMID